jgi:cytochrome c oxidase subunit IV
MSHAENTGQASQPIDYATPAGHEGHGVHVVPVRLLLTVFAALMALTIITVAVTYVDLGAMNVWVALFIAVIKAGLVAMYFMHLRWDSPFNGIILITALFFVALFIGIAVLDSREYHDTHYPPQTLRPGP